MLKKKLTLWILIAAVVLSVVGLGFGIAALLKTKGTSNTGDKLATTSSVEYFDDVQYQDQLAVLRAWAVGDKFTKLSYQIDTAAEVNVTNAVTDEATKDWTRYNLTMKGKNYIDSGVLTIDVSALTEGKHIMQVYVYNGESKECIYEKVFTVKA